MADNWKNSIKCPGEHQEVSKEHIRQKLFSFLYDLDLDNGKAVDLSKAVEHISESLGLSGEKKQLGEYINALLTVPLNGEREYQYVISCSDKGTIQIQASYDRLYDWRREKDKEEKKEAESILKGFVDKAKQYVGELETEKAHVNMFTLYKKFEQGYTEPNSRFKWEKDKYWIEIAVSTVLESEKSER